MTIRPYLGGEAFEPEIVGTMAEAFEIICRSLELNPKVYDAATRRVADAIIMAVRTGAADTEMILHAAYAQLGIGIDKH